LRNGCNRLRSGRVGLRRAAIDLRSRRDGLRTKAARAIYFRFGIRGGVNVSDASATSDTPLSDLIAVHMARGSPESWGRFLDGFRKSQVGVVVVGVPAGTAGEFVSTADRPVSVGLTRPAGGPPMALAFADPEAFAARFGRTFNGALAGEALLATVLLEPTCAGVLVNSALAEVSVVIDRVTAESLVRPTGERPGAKPWWRFW
jgi:hypothetical protein